MENTQILSPEEKETWSEIETRSIEDVYLTRLNRQITSLKKTSIPEPKPFLALPKPWLAVHFFLDEKGLGHVLLYDSTTQTWETRDPFKIEPIWEAYLAWKSTYYAAPSMNRIDYCKAQTEELCKVLGEEMGFLFDLPGDRNRPVLFIPHRFLRMLPIHAAYQNGVYFFTQHPSLYLPAWSLSGVQTDSKQNAGAEGKVLFKKFEDFDRLGDLKVWNEKFDPASPENIMALETPPELLILLSHGKADPVNPFNSRFILQGDLTYYDIFERGPLLTGSRVILGACETDMAAPPSGPLDEHLSLSTSFLQKGAQAVLGTLWQVASKDVEEMILHVLGNSEKLLHEIVREQQIEWMKEVGRNREIYDIIPFRVIGYPV